MHNELFQKEKKNIRGLQGCMQVVVLWGFTTKHTKKVKKEAV